MLHVNCTVKHLLVFVLFLSVVKVPLLVAPQYSTFTSKCEYDTMHICPRSSPVTCPVDNRYFSDYLFFVLRAVITKDT